jgi:hypothetical protein
VLNSIIWKENILIDLTHFIIENIGKSRKDDRMKSWDETNAECLIIIPIFMLRLLPDVSF